MRKIGNHLSEISYRWGMIRLMLLVCGLLGMVSTVQAQSAAGSGVSIQISRESVTMMAGDWTNFETVLQNNGPAATPPLAVHLSIAAVETGHHVDPEDWSPQRTQFLPPLLPGESVQLNWELHALFEGEFTAFVTVVSADGAFASTMSHPLRLHVTADNILPMRKVIPVVTAVPIFPLILLLSIGLYTRKQRMG